MRGCQLWRISAERTLIRPEYWAVQLPAILEKPAVLQDSCDQGSTQRMLGQGALAEGEDLGSNLLQELPWRAFMLLGGIAVPVGTAATHRNARTGRAAAA
jgi:hypothetical protein